MTHHSSYLLQDVAGMSVIVPTGSAAEDFPGMISVNETGRLLWEALETPKTEQDLCDLLLETYEVDPDTAARDVRAFLEKLRQAGALAD